MTYLCRHSNFQKTAHYWHHTRSCSSHWCIWDRQTLDSWWGCRSQLQCNRFDWPQSWCRTGRTWLMRLLHSHSCTSRSNTSQCSPEPGSCCQSIHHWYCKSECHWHWCRQCKCQQKIQCSQTSTALFGSCQHKRQWHTLQKQQCWSHNIALLEGLHSSDTPLQQSHQNPHSSVQVWNRQADSAAGQCRLWWSE